MNGATIAHILQTSPCTNLAFQGFASPDIFMKISKFPALIILNTGISDGPGEHWCILYCTKKNKCEFFDSYGQPPHVYNFTHFLAYNNINKIMYNPQRLQGHSSMTCGHYCIYYALHRNMGFPMSVIIKNFDPTDFRKNDNRVFNYVGQFGNIMTSIK